MSRYRCDRVGTRYGKLIVTKNLEISEGGNKGGLWQCQCDCGNTLEVRGQCLKRKGHGVDSCGCDSQRGKFAHHHVKYHITTINRQYHYHKNSARRRGLTPLPKADWEKIVFKPCAYCGEIDVRNIALDKEYLHRVKIPPRPEDIPRFAAKMNGVDRVDSNLDYTVDNCVPCCSLCNRMKLDYSVEEFLSKICKIYAHSSRQEPCLFTKEGVSKTSANDPIISQ